jgi:hypothetical protein
LCAIIAVLAGDRWVARAKVRADSYAAVARLFMFRGTDASADRIVTAQNTR